MVHGKVINKLCMYREIGAALITSTRLVNDQALIDHRGAILI